MIKLVVRSILFILIKDFTISFGILGIESIYERFQLGYQKQKDKKEINK